MKCSSQKTTKLKTKISNLQQRKSLRKCCHCKRKNKKNGIGYIDRPLETRGL